MPSRAWWRARRRLLRFWAIGFVASVAVTLLSSFTAVLESTQTRTLDVLLRLRGAERVANVVIVAVDDAAFASLGERQPVSRAYLATLVRALERAGASAVGLDFDFSTPTAEDADLAAAVRAFADGGVSRVVLPATLPATGPLAAFRASSEAVIGAVEMPEDGDAAIRRVALVHGLADRPPEPALATAVVARHLGFDARALSAAIASGHVPIGGDGETLRAAPNAAWRINFVGPRASFLTIPAGAVAPLAEPGTPVAAANPLRGKPVLVGATFRASLDFPDTPRGAMPGVEVHANVVHMMLVRSFVRPPAWLLAFGLQVLVVLGAGVAVVTLHPILATVVCLAGPFVIGVPASVIAFHGAGYWVDFMLPVVTTRLFWRVADTLEQRRLQAAFGQYVSREVAARVATEAPALDGERRTVSILCSGLRDFTSISERMEPAEIATSMTEYFAAMTGAVFQHRGMINDFVGDAIMAVFGAPLDDPDHALHAAQTAVAMERALATFNRAWTAADRAPLRMGIAIHTGEVFAGNVGKGRVKYTLVGDAVNVAGGVEALNKELGTTVLVTDATRAALGDRARLRDCGVIPVKGRNEPVHVHELVDVDAPPPARKRRRRA